MMYPARRKHFLVASLVLLVWLASPRFLTAQSSSFQGLGQLQDTHLGSYGYSVAGTGPTAVGAVHLQDVPGYLPYRWEHGALDVLEPPVGVDGAGFANAVSSDGLVVVGSIGSPFGRAFRWTSADGMVQLGSLSPTGGSSAHGVSADGAVIVGSSASPAGTQAFRWTSSEGMVGLGSLVPQNFFSAASGVSADGAVVVGRSASRPGYYEAFRWTASDGMVSLGDLPGGAQYSIANAISADGSTIVGYGYSAAGKEAFEWTADGGMIGLGNLPDGTSGSSANAVSEDGSIIGGASLYNAAFIWNAEHGMQNLQDLLTGSLGLDLTGWHLSDVSGISTSGDTIYLVGNALNPLGQDEGYIATIPKSALMPEPGCLMALGLIPLVLGRRRRQVL